jgi:hypothetical protein
LEVKETIAAVWKVFKKIFMLLTLTFVFVLIATYFIALLLGLEIFFFTTEGHLLSLRVYPMPILLFMLFQVETPFALSWGFVFFLIWSIYLLCFLAAWMWRERFHKVVGEALSTSSNGFLNNFLLTMPVIASTLLMCVIAIQNFQEAIGVPTGEPTLPENPYETFFVLAYSSVIEEIGFRLSPIGLFLLIYILSVGGKSALELPLGQLTKLFFAAFLYPEKAKGMVGLKTVETDGLKAISIIEWIMILVTAFIFGLAHLLSGIGWDVGKVTSTFLVGFVFGFLYIVYGFQAPILLHWYFNYYFYTFEFASELYPATHSIQVLIFYLTIIVGTIGLLTFLVLGLRKIFGIKLKEKEQSVTLLF